jgi:hypothetical protein
MDIFLFFALVSIASVFAPLVLGLLQFKRGGVESRLLTILCCASLLADIISYYFFSKSKNNWIILNAYVIIQAFTLILLLSRYLSLRYKWPFLLSFLIFGFINLLFIQKPKTFNSYTSYLGGLILILLCLIYLYRLLRDLPTIDIYRFAPVWVVFAVLTYYGGTLFLFLFNNYLLSTNLVTHKSVWVLNNSLNIIKNLLFAQALWQHHRNVRLSR